MNSETVLSLHNLTWSYPDADFPVLQGLNLEIHQGDFLIIQGASGSGKTTLMKLLTGSLPVGHGHIFAGRDDISRYSSKELQSYKQKLGLVFQHNNLLENKNIADNITYPLWLQGMSFDDIHSSYETITSQLGISHLGGKSLHQLSGGEKQKVSFARAMIKQPSLVIADEPTGNLDWESTKEIAKLMLASHKLGHTMVVITHDVLFAKYIAQQCDVRTLQLKTTTPSLQIQSASTYTRGSLLPHTAVSQKKQS